ncbi:MAG TPA: hypothetical protein VLS90_08570 [Thermodesulfobacteriota bacterium]|nr:hypothetical protein [Thermodesulfobacteriota bacterium]
MKVNTNIMRILVLFVVMGFAVSLGASTASAAKGVTITGRIEHGKLVADNGRTYILKHNTRGRELLLDHPGQRVEVHGWLSNTRAQNILSVDRIDHIYG